MKHAVSNILLAFMLALLAFLPTTTNANSKKVFQVGKASWYGAYHHGRKTANGERFNMHGLTAAHRTLPLGSVIRVKNKTTGDAVTVRVNDRGPYHGNRVLDLSKGAASKLGLIKSGLGEVEITVLSRPDRKSNTKRKSIADITKPVIRNVEPSHTSPNASNQVDIELLALKRQVLIESGPMSKISPPVLPEPVSLLTSVEIDPLAELIERIEQRNTKDFATRSHNNLNRALYTYQRSKTYSLNTTDMF